MAREYFENGGLWDAGSTSNWFCNWPSTQGDEHIDLHGDGPPLGTYQVHAAAVEAIGVRLPFTV